MYNNQLTLRKVDGLIQSAETLKQKPMFPRKEEILPLDCNTKTLP